MLDIRLEYSKHIEKELDRISNELKTLPKEAVQEYKKLTPVDKGNARRKTTLNGNTINADYPYAGRLDAGHSNQAPNGMTEPFNDWIAKEVSRKVKK